jgi:hypothetical protein
MAEPIKIRRFPLTPGRLLVALLAVEGVLWLANWLRWLPKGYAVLLAVACVGVFFLVMLGWFLGALVFKWRFQFSLLSLLVLMVAVALPFSWLATEMRAAGKQREVREAIEKPSEWPSSYRERFVIKGGLLWYARPIYYDHDFDAAGRVSRHSQPLRRGWLESLVGDDFFVDVVQVDLYQKKSVDRDLEHIGSLPRLRSLDFSGTDVSDSGLQHLEGLSEIKELDLSHTRVSDAGLEHITSLSQLQSLGLANTHVTDAGVKKLHKALPNCEIRR